jgi:alkylation response protein AidB-like acyl-CoA dehydrogenase
MQVATTSHQQNHALHIPRSTAIINAMSTFTESDRDALLADVEAYCTELRPVEDECYLAHKRNDAIITLAKKHNLLGMIVPRELGGRGADSLTLARAIARINHEGNAVRTFFSCQTAIGQYPIIRFGTDDQKSRYLPASCAGDCILAFALTEPDAGSNPLEGTTTYKDAGDHYILNGSKYLISNASIAHAVITFAFPADENGTRIPDSRMSAFIIDTGADTYRAEPLHHKPGMYTCDTAQFTMTEHRVPKANMLGGEGNGFRVAMHSLISGRLSVAAGSLGTIEDVLNEVLAYATTRHQHGKPIGKHQLIQDHIAMIEMARATSDALIERAAIAKQRWDDHPDDAQLRAEADMLVAQAKFHASNAAWDAADRAVQILGGRGWMEDNRPMRHLQDVRVCRLYEGTDEIMKLKIASSLLGKDYEAFR